MFSKHSDVPYILKLHIGSSPANTIFVIEVGMFDLNIYSVIVSDWAPIS